MNKYRVIVFHLLYLLFWKAEPLFCCIYLHRNIHSKDKKDKIFLDTVLEQAFPRKSLIPVFTFITKKSSIFFKSHFNQCHKVCFP